MPRDKRLVENALVRKGFQQEESHHSYFFYYTQAGERTQIRTRTSHGTSSKSLSDNLLSLMARQCKLSKKDFLQLVDCPLERKAYEELLESSGSI